jgi:branched-chain amino acid transport system substrate-binding protein
LLQRSRACLPRKRGIRCLPKVRIDGLIKLGSFVRWPTVLASAFAVFLLGVGSAHAQISDNVVKIGVMNDQSGLYADLGGPGSVVAARMAAEDAGGSVLGKPIEIVAADHQNKADIGVAVARRWFESEAVDMAIGFDNSSVALAVEQLAAEHNRIAIAGAVGSTAFTGKNCTANEASWVYDSYALTTSLAKSIVAEGRDTWFFITVDYAFGHSMEADATAAVLAAGGKVLGSVRHPLNTSDFSSYLLQAQASGAKVVALANGGGDMVNTVKQANEFGLTRKQSLVSMLVFISDVHSMQLQAAQGLKFVTAFYWDRDDDTRAWSRRFFDKQGRMPTMAQASVYSAVRHYIASIKAAGTDEAKAVMAKMRELPVNDFYVKNGHVREDGRLLHDMLFVQVKTPAESRGPWDYYKILGTVPGDQAFRPMAEGGCPLVH